MGMLQLIFLVLALVLFLIAAMAPEPWLWRLRAVAAGLAAWVASLLSAGLR